MLSMWGHSKLPNFPPTIIGIVFMNTMIKKVISYGGDSITARLGSPRPMARSIGINMTKPIRETISIIAKKDMKLLNILIIL